MLDRCAPQRRRCRFLSLTSLRGLVVVSALAGWVSTTHAQETAPEKEAKPAETVEPGAVMSPDENPLQQIARGMRDAGTRLEKGQLDEETRQLQRKIVADLEKLLKQQGSSSSDSPPSGGSSQSPESPQDGQPSDQSPSDQKSSSNPPSAAGGSGGGGNQRRSDQENAAESQERTEGGIPSDAERKRQRQVLTDAVWGHLPPAVREQLNRSFNDRYLPEYDAQIRRYYEALATRRRKTPSGATAPAPSPAPAAESRQP